MSIFQALILGLVEGLTEFLPVSSTAHLLLARQLLHLADAASASFVIFVQLGAIAAVVWLYAGKLWQTGWSAVVKLAVAWLPTAVIGLIFYHLIKTILFGRLDIIVGALIVGGLILIIFDRAPMADHLSALDFGKLTYRQAFLIGLAQSVAIVPGVSRAAATMLGGLAVGLNRRQAVEFSFLLAVPTLLAAAILDLYKGGAGLWLSMADNWLAWVVGCLAALVSALLIVRWLVGWSQKHSLAGWGWYPVGLGVVVGLTMLEWLGMFRF